MCQLGKNDPLVETNGNMARVKEYKSFRRMAFRTLRFGRRIGEGVIVDFLFSALAGFSVFVLLLLAVDVLDELHHVVANDRFIVCAEQCLAGWLFAAKLPGIS